VFVVRKRILVLHFDICFFALYAQKRRRDPVIIFFMSLRLRFQVQCAAKMFFISVFRTEDFFSRNSIKTRPNLSRRILYQNMQKNQSNNYLFYSNSCKHSRDLIRFMQSKGILDLVKLICVDTIERSKIPKYVQSVPLLNLAGEQRPLIGKAAFAWAERITNSSIPGSPGDSRECAFEPRNRVPQVQLQKPANFDASQQVQQQVQPQQSQPQEIEAWRESEWSSSTISDSYSFITDCPGGVCRNFESLQNQTPLPPTSSLPASQEPPARPSRNMNVTFSDRGTPSNDSSEKNSQEIAKRLEAMKMQREMY